MPVRTTYQVTWLNNRWVAHEWTPDAEIPGKNAQTRVADSPEAAVAEVEALFEDGDSMRLRERASGAPGRAFRPAQTRHAPTGQAPIDLESATLRIDFPFKEAVTAVHLLFRGIDTSLLNAASYIETGETEPKYSLGTGFSRARLSAFAKIFDSLSSDVERFKYSLWPDAPSTCEQMFKMRMILREKIREAIPEDAYSTAEPISGKEAVALDLSAAEALEILWDAATEVHEVLLWAERSRFDPNVLAQMHRSALAFYVSWLDRVGQDSRIPLVLEEEARIAFGSGRVGGEASSLLSVAMESTAVDFLHELRDKAADPEGHGFSWRVAETA